MPKNNIECFRNIKIMVQVIISQRTEKFVKYIFNNFIEHYQAQYKEANYYKFKGRQMANFVLISWNKDSYLQGQYAFPFYFQLPAYIPGSFHEETPQYKGTIKYQIKIVCISHKPKIPHVQCSSQIIVRQPQKSKQQSMYGEIFIYPQTCFCRKHGVSRICCYFQKNQYMPGQECITICEADNYKCSLGIRQIKVQFFKQINLSTKLGQEIQIIKQIRSQSFPGLDPQSMYMGQNAKKISLPLSYRQQNIPIHPSTQGKLVKCSYFLQVTPINSGMCVKNNNFFRISLNILQKGLIKSEIEQPQNWNPEVFKQSQIFFNEKVGQNQNLAKMNQYD